MLVLLVETRIGPTRLHRQQRKLAGKCPFFQDGNWHLNVISLSQRLWDEMTLMIVRWLIRFLSIKAMKEFIHRMRLHYFLKTTVRDILGRGDCTKGDPFYLGCVLSRSGEAIACRSLPNSF